MWTNGQITLSEHPRRDRSRSGSIYVSAPHWGGLERSDDLLGDLVAEARRGARGETGAPELLERENECASQRNPKRSSSVPPSSVSPALVSPTPTGPLPARAVPRPQPAPSWA